MEAVPSLHPAPLLHSDLQRPEHREHGDQNPAGDLAALDVHDVPAGEAPAVVLGVVVVELASAIFAVHRNLSAERR